MQFIMNGAPPCTCMLTGSAGQGESAVSADTTERDQQHVHCTGRQAEGGSQE